MKKALSVLSAQAATRERAALPTPASVPSSGDRAASTGATRAAVAGSVSASGTHWLRRLAFRLRLLDLALVLSAVGTALVVRFGSTAPVVQLKGSRPDGLPPSYLVLSLLLVLGWMAFLVAGRSYDGRVLGVGAEEYKRVVRASTKFWGLVAIVCYLGQLELARGFVAVSMPLGLVLLLLGRWSARKVLHRARRTTRAWSHRVLVVGGREEVFDLVNDLRREPYAGLDVVGACIPAGDDSFRAKDHLPVVGTLTDVPEAVAACGVDTVAVTASRGLTSAVLKQLGWSLEGAGVDLVVAPALTDVAGPRVHVRPVSGLPLLYVEQPEFSGPIRLVKGAFDRLAAVLGLLLALPVLVVAGVAIKATSPGPVIFRQERVGRDGRLFKVLKLRTMVVDAEDRLAGLQERNEADGALFKLRRDPRVTRVGALLRRFSLDELPQLVNVVTGDMSLVGPRPALPCEAETYGRSVARRLLVQPGITGLWQVSGRSDLEWDDAVRLDLYYVENWSFAGDLQILWKTLGAVVHGRGAY